MPRTISICGWDEYQHYKDRDPSWIKLYRDLLTTESWVLGTDRSRLVQIASTLLAARYKNAIPMHHDLFRKVAHLDMGADELEIALQHLAEHKFLEIKGESDPASGLLAKRSTEKRRVEERREDPTASSTPTAKAVSRETTPEWFLDFKLAYPERASGDQGWRKALRAANARIAEGHTPQEFIDGANRYARYCDSTEKTGTEFVKQAATFLGPDKHFLLPWTPSPILGRPTINPQAAEAWNRLIESDGSQRDGAAQRAIEVIGGWQRIRMRTAHDEQKIRTEFCHAYVGASA